MSGENRGNRYERARRWGGPALIAAALLLCVARIAAIHTESVNWDEFALLDRVERTLETGTLHAGGRSGLAVLVLAPLVEECRSAIATVRAGRLLWAALTLVYLAGVFVLLRRLLRRSDAPAVYAALGVALLAAVPVFYRWSLQVRTDQLALAAGIWGSVALIWSSRRTGWALLAGLLFGLGYLATRKLVYVAGLGLLLAAADALLAGLRTRELLRFGATSALRIGLAVAAAVAVWLAYGALLPRLFVPRDPVSLGAAFDLFSFYRGTIGYRVYGEIAPTLLVHALLAGLALAAAARRPEARRDLCAAGCVAGLGLAVGLFHAGAFAYFWLTLGLFPAVALALAAPHALRVLPPPARSAALPVAFALLGATLLPTAIDTLRDTQAIQRESLRFAEQQFGPDAHGFQPDGALFCRHASDPLPVYMLEHVVRRFGGPRAARNANWLLEQFRARPVLFVVGSQPLYQLPFPESVRRFWAEHYLPYRGAVMVPGRRVRGPAGHREQFDLLVGGAYRWIEPGAAASGRRADAGSGVTLDGRPVPRGAPFQLEAGPHVLELQREVRRGFLVYALDEPPDPSWELAFYSKAQLREIAGP